MLGLPTRAQREFEERLRHIGESIPASAVPIALSLTRLKPAERGSSPASPTPQVGSPATA